MFCLWIDDERATPAYALNKQPFDASVTTTNEDSIIFLKKMEGGIRKNISIKLKKMIVSKINGVKKIIYH